MRNNPRGWPAFIVVVFQGVAEKQQWAGQSIGLVIIVLGIFADKQDAGGLYQPF
jgi:hypothetical protein